MYVRTVKPIIYPLTLNEVKDHLRISNNVTTYDTYLLDLLRDATGVAETETNRALLTSTWVLYLDRFPAGDILELWKCPVQSITSIQYYDSDNALQTFSTNDWISDLKSEPARVQLNQDSSWPETYVKVNSVQITFISGWASELDIPNEIIRGLKLLIAFLYEKRGDEMIDKNKAVIATTAKSFFMTHKVFDY